MAFRTKSSSIGVRGGTDLQTLAVLIAPLDPVRTQDQLATVRAPRAANLIALARAHGVEAWLAGCVSATDPVWSELREQRTRFTAERLRRRADLADLATALAGIECPWVVLKGEALALSAYPRADLRFGVDVDVLVPPDRMIDVLDVLAAADFELLDQNWPLIRRYLPGELKLRSSRGTLIDLHWHLINSASVRGNFRLSTAELLSTRRILSGGLWALSEVDQLLHAIVHAALSGGNRLSWLLDIALAAQSPSARQGLAARAIAGGAGPAAGIMIDRARGYFRIDQVAGEQELPGMAYRRLGLLVNRSSPLRPDVDQPSMARSVARSARSGSRASLIELSRHGGSWLRSGAPRRYLRPGWADHLDEGSLLRPVPDDRARAEYFDLIARHG